MKLKALITAAGPGQRHILHQALTTADGKRQTIAEFLLELVSGAVDEVGIVIPEGDSPQFQSLFAENGRVRLIEQASPRGYAHAIYTGREFLAGDPFLHLVGDHFYLAERGDEASSLVAELVRIHRAEGASISAVTPTREGLLPYFGAVGGQALGGRLYQIDTVLEKPTPTQAERELSSPGIRQGQYLCFFGMHLFTPALLEILHDHYSMAAAVPNLSYALQLLARQERYLATILPGRRFDIGSKYGLLQAQLALGLQGRDREEILSMMLELSAR